MPQKLEFTTVKQPDTAAGFSAGVKYWLFFMLTFALLRYPAGTSIALGAVGGLVGGTIVAWQNTKEQDVPVKPSQKDPAKQVPFSPPAPTPQSRPRFQKYGLTGLKPRQRRAVRRFSWLFRRK